MSVINATPAHVHKVRHAQAQAIGIPKRGSVKRLRLYALISRGLAEFRVHEAGKEDRRTTL